MSSFVFCCLEKKQGKVWSAALGKQLSPRRKISLSRGKTQTACGCLLFVSQTLRSPLLAASPTRFHISHDLIIVVGDNNAHGDRKSFSKTGIVFSRLCREETINISDLCFAMENNEDSDLNLANYPFVMSQRALAAWSIGSNLFRPLPNVTWSNMRLPKGHKAVLSELSSENNSNFNPHKVPVGSWMKSVVCHVPPWSQFTTRQQLQLFW